MHVLGIVGPGSGDVVGRLVPQLDGQVATVERAPDADGGVVDADVPTVASKTGVTSAFGVADDGTWIGAGDGGSLEDLLDSLAPTHDYAVVSGFSGARVPTVVVGDAEVEGEVVSRVPAADAVDIDALASQIAEYEPYVTLASLVAEVKASPLAERAGAIATFTGQVRAKDASDDDRTTHLEFEKYEGVAEERMEQLREELTDREGVLEVRFHHRTGRIREGEDIVHVVVLAGHRREAFRAVEDGIDRLKEVVPIFKKESTVEASFWVHDRE